MWNNLKYMFSENIYSANIKIFMQQNEKKYAQENKIYMQQFTKNIYAS